MKTLAAVGLLSLLAWQSHRQMPRFHDDLALWSAAVAVAPAKPRPLVNYASALMAAGTLAGVPALQERALALSAQPWVSAHQRHMTEHVVAFNLFQIALSTQHADVIIPAYERLARVWPEGVYQAAPR